MMNRRQGHKVKKKQRGYGYRILIVMLGVLLVAGVGVMAYQYHRCPANYPALQALAARVDTWWIERKARIQNKLQKTKEKTPVVAAAKAKNKTEAAADSFHFEFYTMLPGEKQLADITDKKAEAKTPFNHEALEEAFAKEMKKAAYVIQTGIFSNANIAEKTRQALADNGLSSKVVKAYMGDHLVYRLQVGPYEEQEKINEAQNKLAAIGVRSTLHRLSAKIEEETA